MLLTKTVIVKWNPKHKDHYISRGYVYTKRFEEFEVKIEDLALQSKVKVLVKCDYCGKEYPLQYYFYTKASKDIINKDACKKCNGKKQTEIIQITHGVANRFQLEEIKEKSKQTMLKKYGYEHNSQVPEIREKVKKTNLERYGVESAMQNEEIKQKMKDTMLENWGVENFSNYEHRNSIVEESNMKKFGVPYPMQNEEVKRKARESFYKNATCPTSSQQRYLHCLLGGELNYPEGVSSLDIAFPEDKIYVEYDGNGHDLSVRRGSITQDEFNKRQKRRYFALRDNGWKCIRIISLKNKVPSKEKTFEIFNFAKSYLNEGHSYIKFNLDENQVESSEFCGYYDFGKLQKTKVGDYIWQ